MPVSWDGDNETGFKVEIQVDAWDRHRLLEDLSRTFAEAGINIVEARCLVQHPMTRNRFVIEVGDTQALKAAINRLRAIDCVFDAYRVIPAGVGRIAQGAILRRVRRAPAGRERQLNSRAKLTAEKAGAHEVPLAVVRGRSGRSAAATTCGSFGWGCWFFMQEYSPQRPV